MSENPLKSYFRRPALYLTLPSKGIGYPPGVINFPENNELPVYPMTAIDEVTSRTPDALFNGVAIIELVKSCVPNVIDPWRILQTDLDSILLAIKIASNGSEMDIDTTCPSCTEDAKYGVNLSALLAGYKVGDYSVPLEVDDLLIKFSPIDYKRMNAAGTIQFDIQRDLAQLQRLEEGIDKDNKTSEIIKMMSSVTMDLIADTIEFIKTPDVTVLEKEHIREFIDNCSSQTYEKIRTYSTELKKSSEAQPLHFKCIHCQHEYDQPFNINVSDFFG
jgi:hypothetical protein